MSLQQNVAAEHAGKFTCVGKTFEIIVTCRSYQSCKLLRMRCKYQSFRQLLQPCLVGGKHVERIRIENHRCLVASHLSYQRNGRVLCLPKSGTDTDRLILSRFDRLREIRFLTVELQYCLRNR